MARTIRISKSKALNFKKLSFLYLIFIVFFFFSTSGDYIRHFVTLAHTQSELNTRLKEQLNNYQTSIKDEQALKLKSVQALEVLDGLLKQYETFVGDKKLSAERLKEQKFSKEFLLANEPAQKLHVALSEFVSSFPASYQGALAADLGLKLEDILLKEPIKNQFLKELPNGAIGSILNHMQTVVLLQSLKYFKQEIEEGGMVKVTSTKDSSFLQGFKDVYYVGEYVSFDFFSRDSTAPTISINQVSMTPQFRGRHYKINWTPTKEGTYQLEANIGEEYIRRSFKVIKPSMRFLENEQEIAAFIAEPLTLTIDISGLEKIKNLRFKSNGAEIVTQKDQIILTPKNEGRFTIEMYAGENLLDSRSMFARKGKAPEVILKDVAGAKTSLNNAHCLESMSPLWQVVNFNITVVQPNGSSKKLKSKTRFLRNELRSIEKTSPIGSTIIFDEIRLLNVNGISTTYGAPIFIGK